LSLSIKSTVKNSEVRTSIILQ